ncbi:MAG: MerR family transcriptional regulator [Burkholderiaceae bacterium]
MLSISAVERDIGLSKDTLRIWERRYGFPCPQRDAFGERRYPVDQVQRLRLMRRLLDEGYRPGKLVALPLAELQALAGHDSHSLAVDTAKAGGDELLGLALDGRVDELRRALGRTQRQFGTARFVIEVAAPLARAVAAARARGELPPYAEQLFGESMQIVLRHAIFGLAAPGPQTARARMLLTTLPGECQASGLLMIEALAVERGARCLSLGIQTPIPSIVLAAEAQRADMVLLSFAGSLGPRQTIAGLAALRAALPATVAVWACCTCPALQRRRLDGVRLIESMAALAEALDEALNEAF